MVMLNRAMAAAVSVKSRAGSGAGRRAKATAGVTARLSNGIFTA